MRGLYGAQADLFRSLAEVQILACFAIGEDETKTFWAQ
jgi:hypothetical protein